MDLWSVNFTDALFFNLGRFNNVPYFLREYHKEYIMALRHEHCVS